MEEQKKEEHEDEKDENEEREIIYLSKRKGETGREAERQCSSGIGQVGTQFLRH